MHPLLKVRAPEAPSAPDARVQQDRRAVLLIHFGNPFGKDIRSARRYVSSLLADRRVVRLPLAARPLQLLAAPVLARALITRPLQDNVLFNPDLPALAQFAADQALAVQSALPGGWRVYHALHYGEPSIRSAVEQIVESGVEEVVVIPMRPQFSEPMAGNILEEFYKCIKIYGPHLQIEVRSTWFDDSAYIDAMAQQIATHAQDNALDTDDTTLLLWGPALPRAYVRRGDPYAAQTLRTAQFIRNRLGWPAERAITAFRGWNRSIPWIQPDVKDVLADLASAGNPHVIACNVTSPFEAPQILQLIGGRYVRQDDVEGAQCNYTPPSSQHPAVKSLTMLVRRGRHSVTDIKNQPQPLLTQQSPTNPVHRDIDSLVMIGSSLANRLGRGRGPGIESCTPEQLKCLKRPHLEAIEMLKQLKEQANLQECFVWNTCNRFELYAWLDAPASSADRQNAIQTAASIISADRGDAPINVLHAEDARTHMLRTAAGLNSWLVGDAEVVDQLDAASRTAAYAQTAGSMTDALISDITQSVCQLRQVTSWGDYSHRYCDIALRRLSSTLAEPVANGRCLVIGGSTTSASLLESLQERFTPIQESLTLVYRGHRKGRLARRLRSAVGKGRMLTVEQYTDQAVLDAALDADVIFLAIDQRLPIITAGQLSTIRDLAKRPLTILDFNTFGSTSGFDAVKNVNLLDAQAIDAIVGAFTTEVLEDLDFAAARTQAETWIRTRCRAQRQTSPALHHVNHRRRGHRLPEFLGASVCGLCAPVCHYHGQGVINDDC